MTWDEVYRIRVFGDPVETPRPRHRIVGTKDFNEWCEAGRPEKKPADIAAMLFVHTYMPTKADAWKRTIRYHAAPFIEGDPLEGPIRVDSEIIMPRPAGHSGTGRNAGMIKPSAPSWHHVAADKDNLEKSILDALSPTSTIARKKLSPTQAADPVYNFSGLWRNDAQVCSGLVEKRYHSQGEEPGAIIVVSKWTIPNVRPTLGLGL